MAETIIGIKCNDYILVAASGLGSHYYIKITDKDDKMTLLDSHKLMACSGENGPRVNFTEYIKCNMQLNKVRQHGRIATTPAAAAFMRQTLAGALRSRDGAYGVNCLVAGYDKPVSEHDDTPAGTHLYYMDYLGTMQAVPYGAHGYGASFVVALLDRHWRPDLTAQEGLDLLQKCCDEVKKRIIISHHHFICRSVTETGIELLPQVN